MMVSRRLMYCFLSETIGLHCSLWCVTHRKGQLLQYLSRDLVCRKSVVHFPYEILFVLVREPTVPFFCFMNVNITMYVIYPL